MGIEDGLRIPSHLRPVVRELLEFIDLFCRLHLDEEYAELCRRLTAKLARKRPSPLMRGDLLIWAGAIIHVVGSINFLFDRSQRPYLAAMELSALIGVPKSTLANKARLIRDMFRLGHFDRELSRRELLERHPGAWMISVNGFIMDARALPPDIQAEARRRGLIPDLPPPPQEGGHSSDVT